MAAKRNYIAFIVVLLLAGTSTNCRSIIKECSHLPATHTAGLAQQAPPETNTATPVDDASDIKAGSPIQLAFKFID